MQTMQLLLRLATKLTLLLLISLPSAANVRGFGDGTISVKPYIDNPGYKLDVEPKVSTNGRKQTMRPHINQQVGIDVSTDIIGIGYGTRVKTLEEDRLLKGETDYDDYRFSLVFSNLFFMLNAQKYKGMYLENSSTIDSSTGGSNPYIQLPDFELTNISINFTYTFAPEDFSLKAAWDQTVRQTESGGSWLAGVYTGDTRFKNEGPLLVSQIRSDFGVDQNIREGRFTSIIPRGGYGHTFVFGRKWFISLTGLIGYGPTFGKTFDGTLDREFTALGILGDAHISLGFNGDTFFTGVFANANTTNYETESLKLQSEVALFRMYLGLRF